jgi:succinate dehydrogenase/fumarate reductase flavoprotein subunit
MIIERKECDVLCVGGGIAGLMAAIRAAEVGAKVIVAEKSNTLRSGAAGVGNDHFQCFIPEVHGNAFWTELFQGQIVGFLQTMDTQYIHHWYENTYDILKLWDSWGIPMKYEGRYEFAGHGFPGRQLNHLKYSGVNQKPVLTKQAEKSGAEIINRVMVFDLLKDKDGNVVGAVGISTREDKVVCFEAKSVVLGSGGCVRVYPSVTPGADNNRAFPVTNSGDGRAMAYRVGAELRDLEIVHRHAGPKYLARCGQATWIGVLRDINGKPVGPWTTTPNRRYGDIATEVSKVVFEEYRKSGRGPVYMDMDGISADDLDYMVHWLKNEGNASILNYVAGEGIDMAKAAIEFQTFEMQVDGGIKANHLGETAVKGLYAAGDEVYATISHAAVFGWSAGEAAARYAKVASPNFEHVKHDVEDKKTMLEEIRSREDGIGWQEALPAMQQIMFDYCGSVRSESLLSTGLKIVRRLKDKVRASLMAGNAHELMNCLQVLNLIDIGELVLISADDRKETRALHIRSDYTFTDPMLNNKIHVIKRKDGEPATDWVSVHR